MGGLQNNLKFPFCTSNFNYNPCSIIINDINPKFENEKSEILIKIFAPKV